MLSAHASRELLKVVKKYIHPRDIPHLIYDLEKIPGNRSYQQTIAKLKALVKEKS